MKTNFLLCLLIGIGIVSCDKKEDVDLLTIDCLPTALQNGVIAFYPFNNGSLTDESANTNNLTNTTTAIASADRDGNASCAYKFDNVNTQGEFLTTSSSNFLNSLTTFSISLWYQPLEPNARPGGQFEALISRGETQRCPDRTGEWSVGLYDCRRAVFGHNNSVWADLTITPTDCTAEVIALSDKWHHVVSVYNDGEYKIYFNGVLQETETGNANCNNLHIAADIGDLFLGKTFTGKLDDILIYDRELSAQEVTDLMDLQACCE